MTKKYAVPNWAQAALATAIGLNPKNVAVEYEDDRCIMFQQYLPHCVVTVGKTDGERHYYCHTAETGSGASGRGRWATQPHRRQGAHRAPQQVTITVNCTLSTVNYLSP